jgi:hypothetical protein
MIKKMIGASALLAALAACAPPLREPAPARELPTVETLPNKAGEDCECLQQNRCVLLEARSGSPEVRNLTCHWAEPDKVVQCDFEERWAYPDNSPEPWRARSLRAEPMAGKGWCAAG